MALSFVISSGIPVFASDFLVSEKGTYTALDANQKRFESMTVGQLNQFIDSIAKKSNPQQIRPNGITPINPGIHFNDLQDAWLAAAMIAKRKGYPCSAELIKCSVKGKDYIETASSDGLFRKKIRKIKPYKNYMKPIMRNKEAYSSGSFKIEKSDNSDLYYALHSVDINTVKSTNNYAVEITDKFDFDPMTEYDSPFTASVNNWAWLCQHTAVLSPIEISITFRENA